MGEVREKNMARDRMYWATALVGVLLSIAPRVLAYSRGLGAVRSDLTFGTGMIALSVIRAARPHDPTNWEYWLIGILGSLAIVAPFALAFTGMESALWASVALGAVALVLATRRVLVSHLPEPRE
jgi:hypothetical protein